MKTYTLQLLSSVSVACGTMLLIAACSLLPQQKSELALTSRPGQFPYQTRIARLNFGSDARFAACAEPACPAVTTKTLAIARDESIATASQSAASSPQAPQPSKQIQRNATVFFQSGSASLSSISKAVLDQSLSAAHEAKRIVISGRTDDVGADAPNQVLALHRATAVRDYLRQHAPTLSSAMEIDAKGRCCFVASNTSEQGRQQNRRVEIGFEFPGR